MTEPKRGRSPRSEATGDNPEALARAVRAKARSAATAALREGLEEIDLQHGHHVADEVAALIDVADVFEGLTERETPGDDDGPWEFQPVKVL